MKTVIVSLAVAWMLTALCISPAAAIEEVPASASADAQPADALEVEARLAFIRERFNREFHQSQNWQRGWAIGMGVITAGQLIAVPFMDNEGDRIDLYFGAGSSAIGVAALYMMPPTVIARNRQIEAEFNAAVTPGERRALLPNVERAFLQEAQRERNARSWVTHAANVFFNVSVGLGLGLGFDRWTSAAIATGSGIALGEVLLLTQPNHLTEDVTRYQNGEWGKRSESSDASWMLQPMLGAKNRAYGLQWSVTF